MSRLETDVHWNSRDPTENGGQVGRNDHAVKLPGAVSLLEQLDKEIIVCLRDGRNFIGRLVSYDQYANLVLEGTVERIVVDNNYADIPRGIFVVRGENVMLLGELDMSREQQLSSLLTRVTEQEICRAQAVQKNSISALSRRDKPDWPIPEEY